MVVVVVVVGGGMINRILLIFKKRTQSLVCATTQGAIGKRNAEGGEILTI